MGLCTSKEEYVYERSHTSGNTYYSNYSECYIPSLTPSLTLSLTPSITPSRSMTISLYIINELYTTNNTKLQSRTNSLHSDNENIINVWI